MTNSHYYVDGYVNIQSRLVVQVWWYVPIKIVAEGWYIITIILLGSLIIHILLFIRKKAVSRAILVPS